MITLLTIIFVVTCVLGILVVLLQSGKEAGMGIFGGGGGSQTVFGSHGADILTRVTTVLLILFLSGALGLTLLKSRERSRTAAILGEARKDTVGGIDWAKSKSKEEDPGIIPLEESKIPVIPPVKQPAK